MESIVRIKLYIISLICIGNACLAQNDPASRAFIREVIGVKERTIYVDAASPYSIEELKNAVNQDRTHDTIVKVNAKDIAATKKRIALMNKQLTKLHKAPLALNIPLPYEVTLLTKEEKAYINSELDKSKHYKWSEGLFINGLLIQAETLRKLFKSQFILGKDDGWGYFHKHYGDRYYDFCKPIFIRNNSMCIFYYDYHCGDRCAHGSLSVYRKARGVWKKVSDLYSWIS